VAGRVCVSLLPRSLGELRLLSGRALELGARIVELRLDGLPRVELGEAVRLLDSLDARRIATLRPVREGGLYAGPEEERLKTLREAGYRADYVDIESDAVEASPGLVDELRGVGVKVISSRHFLGSSPGRAELRRLIPRWLSTADLVKVVNSPSKAQEALGLLTLYREPGVAGRLIAFSMGERWALTRPLSLLLGAPFMYASLPGSAVAPGQMSFEEAVEALEVLVEGWPSSRL